MKAAIICASDDELAPFLPELEKSETRTEAMLTLHCGKIDKNDIIALYSGVCKVNASVAAQVVINRYHPDVIINSGTAGAICKKLKLFDTVISTQTAYHDVADDILTEFHPFMPSLWFHADKRLLKAAEQSAKKCGRIFFGRSVTGETFITDEGRQRIIEKFDPLAVDMESAAIAHVCYVNGVPFLSVRTITDTPDKTGVEEFEKNCKTASETAKRITLTIISEYK